MTPASPWSGLGARAAAPAPEPEEAKQSHASTMREALRTGGPFIARELCDIAGLKSTALVGALLKYDLKLGRIQLRGDKYFWNHAFDEEQAGEIQDAINLLERHGFSVRRPAIRKA